MKLAGGGVGVGREEGERKGGKKRGGEGRGGQDRTGRFWGTGKDFLESKTFVPHRIQFTAKSGSLAGLEKVC